MAAGVHATFPVATYRVQLRAGWTFDRLVDDGVPARLARLGVSHVYLSPITAAGPGSTHGYDVVDPTRIDPDLGGEPGFRRLVEAARGEGLGIVVDIVPNHLAADPAHNPSWRDVLRHGRASAYGDWYDIDWAPPERRLTGSILMPVLEDHYGRIIERGGIRLERHDGTFVLAAAGTAFPVEPSTLAPIIEEAATASGDAVLHLVARSADTLPDPADVPRAAARRGEVEAIDAVLAERAADPEVAAHLDRAVTACNGDVDRLEALVSAQVYRLAYWRAGGRDVPYRRFFDVDTLVGVRMDDPAVFAATHTLIGRLVGDDLIDGVRVDHPDGLADPTGYLHRLRRLIGPDRLLWVEKIIEGDEELPDSWPVDGTTGYEVAEAISRASLPPGARNEMARIWATACGFDWTDTAEGEQDLLRDARRTAVRGLLAPELNRLTERLLDHCEHLPRWRDVTRHDLHEALTAVLSAHPTYRTYIGDHPDAASAQDRDVVTDALAGAEALAPTLDPDLFALIRRELLEDDGPAAAAFRMAFQQLTGPAMAKGKEDTALFRLLAIPGRCEVGADPLARSLGPGALLTWAGARATRWPRAMTLLSTHDTKRGEDVRARSLAAAADPTWWEDRVHAWMAAAATARPPEDGPDPMMRLHTFQTIVDADPIDTERLGRQLVKGAREAKLHTGWLDPDEAYERSVEDFAAVALTDADCRRVITETLEVVRPAGAELSLAWKLLALTLPGVPDLYQGSEGHHLRLTDPDNREPLDLARLDALLDATERPDEAECDVTDERVKVHLVRAALAVRRSFPEAMAGSLTPLEVEEDTTERLIAYRRGEDVVVVVRRFPSLLDLEEEARVALPPGPWIDRLRRRTIDGGPVVAAELLHGLPVALLTRPEPGDD